MHGERIYVCYRSIMYTQDVAVRLASYVLLQLFTLLILVPGAYKRRKGALN